jgi:hypothetical protein
MRRATLDEHALLLANRTEARAQQYQGMEGEWQAHLMDWSLST